jgi:sigma-E factor negative regulatory protein RseB
VTVLGAPAFRAARRAALVAGVGALGAAVCSMGVGAVTPAEPDVAVAPTSMTVERSPRAMGAAEQRALELLRRAVTAQRAVTYSGTQWLSSQASGGAVTIVDVRHDPARGTWFDTRTTAGGHTVPDGQATELDGEALAALTHHYRLAVRGTEHCAGRPATVVVARVLGGDRVAGRFWLDRDTGLLLRRELYDATGGVVRATAFVQLDEGSAAAAVPAAVTRPDTDGPERALDDAALTDLRREGWQLPDLLPGGMERYRATDLTVDGHRVVQLAYSDGLFATSLFVEQGGLDGGALRGFDRTTLAGTTVYVRTGLQRTVVWAGRSAVYTLVLDAPASLTPDLVAALPHRPPDDGMLSRLGRGIHRVGSWANPFD